SLALACLAGHWKRRSKQSRRETARQHRRSRRKELHMSLTTTNSSTTAPTEFLQGKDATYAYRRIGGGFRRPLICLQHFTGTLDNWDPAVADPLGADREVILFDSAGIGRSTGTVPTTVAGMAKHALDFMDALCVTSCDLLGFSLGGMVAQQMAL